MTNASRPIRLTAQILSSAWAAFWTWFCASVAVSEGGRSYLYAGVIIAIAWSLTALAWWRPRFGGFALLCTGLLSAWIFPGGWAWLLMAAPPVLAGIAVMASSRRPRLTPA
jgi:hypothetical protein